MSELTQNTTAAGIRITPSGAIDKVELAQDEHGSTLRALYAAIDCMTVDVVRLTDDLDMWLDDEGMFTAEANTVATKLVDHFMQEVPEQFRPEIYGTVVMLGIDQSTGETLSLKGVRGLSGEQLAQLQAAADMS